MSPLRTNKLTLATVLKIIFTCTLIGLIVWYGQFQARFFLEGPRVTLTFPNAVIQHEKIIPVQGNAVNITDITLNGRRIHTDEAGNFSESLVLENGYTIMTIEVKDRYGRTTSLSRELVYVPAQNN